jgi:hypothetical protein
MSVLFYILTQKEDRCSFRGVFQLEISPNDIPKNDFGISYYKQIWRRGLSKIRCLKRKSAKRVDQKKKELLLETIKAR